MSKAVDLNTPRWSRFSSHSTSPPIRSHGGEGEFRNSVAVFLSFILGLGSAGATAASLAAVPMPPAASRPGYANPHYAELTIRQRIIVRVPVHPNGPPVKWVEKGSRKCVSADEIAGASTASPDALDLILRGGERWRMKFREECPAIGFYQGFYLRPGEDRQICAKRDVIHPRSGGECEIQTFKRLEPEIDD